MKLFKTLLIFSFLSLTSAKAFDSTMPKNDNDWQNKLSSLNWKRGKGIIEYSKANAKIRINNNYEYLEKDDADQLLYWANGLKSDADYVISSKEARYSIFYNDTGYIKIDGWKDVNADQLLRELLKQSEESNPERAKKGRPTVVSMKWFKEPTLDRNRDAVFYSLYINWSDNSNTVSSTVLLLGRSGHAEIKVTQDVDNYRESNVTIVPNIFTFNDNQKYSNFTKGDKVAAVGIAALVAGSLGIKTLAKAGGLVGIIVLLKKFGALLLALPVLFFRKIFGGGKSNSTSETNVVEATEEKKVVKKKK